MELNYLAIVVAALVPLILGFIWYNEKVFGKTWMAETGLSQDKLRSSNMAMIFGFTFVLSLMLAFVMNLIAFHDSFVGGSLYYITNGAAKPEVGSEPAKWLEYYMNNLAASNHTFKHGAYHGFMIAGLMIAVPVVGINALFERKSWKYIAIHAGYWMLCLMLMGGIIAAWR